MSRERENVSAAYLKNEQTNKEEEKEDELKENWKKKKKKKKKSKKTILSKSLMFRFFGGP